MAAKKYAVISGGIVYEYFTSIQEAQDFIDAQTHSDLHDVNIKPRQSFKIVKVEKVYKLTKIDENQNEKLYGFKETDNDDDTDYDTMFDELNVYGDGYDW